MTQSEIHPKIYFTPLIRKMLSFLWLGFCFFVCLFLFGEGDRQTSSYSFISCSLIGSEVLNGLILVVPMKQIIKLCISLLLPLCDA